MEKLQKFTNEITKYKESDMVAVKVTGEAYGEEVGYKYWWTLKTMNGKTYKLNEQLKQKIDQVLETRKFLVLGDDTIPVHQITGISLERENFGPRAGEA